MFLFLLWTFNEIFVFTSCMTMPLKVFRFIILCGLYLFSWHTCLCKFFMFCKRIHSNSVYFLVFDQFYWYIYYSFLYYLFKKLICFTILFSSLLPIFTVNDTNKFTMLRIRGDFHCQYTHLFCICHIPYLIVYSSFMYVIYICSRLLDNITFL